MGEKANHKGLASHHSLTLLLTRHKSLSSATSAFISKLSLGKVQTKLYFLICCGSKLSKSTDLLQRGSFSSPTQKRSFKPLGDATGP